MDDNNIEKYSDTEIAVQQDPVIISLDSLVAKKNIVDQNIDNLEAFISQKNDELTNAYAEQADLAKQIQNARDLGVKTQDEIDAEQPVVDQDSNTVENIT